MTQRIRHLKAIREQLPTWSSEDIGDIGRANLDAVTAEIRKAHVNGVSTEAISEFAKRFRVPPSTLMTIIGSLDAEAFNSAQVSNANRSKEAMLRSIRKGVIDK